MKTHRHPTRLRATLVAVRDAVLLASLLGLAMWKLLELLTAAWARVLLVAALLASPAIGQCCIDPATGQRVCQQQPSTAPQPLPARCGVHVSGDGSSGSGTLVSADVVLTCWHLFRDSQAGIVCRFTDGRQFGGVLIATDPANDLAAVRIRPPSVAPAPVAASDCDGTVAAGGFGGDGRFAVARGRIARWARPTGSTAPCAVMPGTVRPGDSGGGVVNETCELVGVVWGQGDDGVYFTCGRPLRDFARRVLGCQPSRPLVPVQPANPPIADRPSATPQTDYQSALDQQAGRIANVQSELARLQAELAKIKECNCGDCCEKLNARIETLSQMQVVVNNDVRQLQAAGSATPNYDAIAAEVAKRLTHSATITLLDGTRKTQIQPLGKPLEFLQHQRPNR